MKLNIVYALLIIGLFAAGNAWAQDKIITVDGETIPARVVEVRTNDIAYKKPNREDGPLYIIARQNVYMIQYADGSKEVFTFSMEPHQKVAPADAAPADAAASEAPSQETSESLYYKGYTDASMFYKGNGALWGTYGATVLYAPVGLITGIIIGAVNPQIEKTVPDYKMLNNPAYRQGYTKKAKARKWGKVGIGFGLGIVTNVLLFAIINSN